MIHSDAENKRWWALLTKQDQREILGTIIEKTNNSHFAKSVARQYANGIELSGKQLEAVRKWWRD